MEELRKLNKYLSNIYENIVWASNTANSGVRKVTRVDDENSVYHIEELDIYINVTTVEDSYGENDYVSGIKFVKPVVKNIETFE